MKTQVTTITLAIAFYKIRKHLALLMLLITAALHSQSLSEKQDSLYVSEEATVFIKQENNVQRLKNKPPASKTDVEKAMVYVSKDTYIYGFIHFENFKLVETKTRPNTTVHTINKKKLKRGTPISEPKNFVVVKTQDNQQAFHLLKLNKETAVLNNINTHKHLFIKQDHLVQMSSFGYYPQTVFSKKHHFYNTDKYQSFYSRPPPFSFCFTM